MAIVQLYQPTDLTKLNFNRILSGFNDFYDYPGGLIIDEVEYPDVLEFGWYFNNQYRVSDFGGVGITFTGNGETSPISVTGGLVTGYIESGYSYLTERIEYEFSVANISVSAVGIYNAVSSASTVDDYYLIEAMFNGADDFFGSDGNDVIYGYGGNDDITPYSGTDIIDGGTGVDFVHLNYDLSSYQVTQKNSIYTFSAGSDINKITNVEYFSFNGSEFLSLTQAIVGNITLVIVDNTLPPNLPDLTQENLYKTASGAYVIDELGLSPGESTSNPVTLARGSKNYTFRTDPTGIVDNGLDQHYIYSGSGSKWTKEVFNSNSGQYVTKVNYTLSQLLTDESTYSLDFNGDGAIGDSIAYFYAESSWTQDLGDDATITFAVGLYRSSITNAFILDDYGLSVGDPVEYPVTLVKGNANYNFTGEITGVVDTFDYADVYERNGSSWVRHRFDDDTGIYKTKTTLTAYQILEDENIYSIDLDGNGESGSVAGV